MHAPLKTAGALAGELEAALRAAEAAGASLLGFLDRVSTERKADGEMVSEADRAADEILRAHLSNAFPGDALLTEETPDDRERLDSSRVWVVDPLDGTREYLTGIDEWAIHVGLAIDGSPALGVVHRPSAGETWTGIPGAGAFVRRGPGRGFEPIVPKPFREPVRVVLSRRDLGETGRRWLACLPPFEELRCGGSGLKAMFVAEGDCHVYGALTPKMKEWDTCAPHAIVEAAGGFCADLLGRPLRYNRRNVLVDQGFLVVAPGAVERLAPAIQAAAAVVPWLRR